MEIPISNIGEVKRVRVSKRFGEYSGDHYRRIDSIKQEQHEWFKWEGCRLLIQKHFGFRIVQI